ncbi:alpha/beta fold hydrolase [Francisellaceae bacterium]|nr:alpha/beta fold hydrolase [Francisellaceae bacterium]
MLKKNLILLSGWGFKSTIWENIFDDYQAVKILQINDLLHLSFDESCLTLSKEIPQNSILIAWSFSGLFALRMASLIPDNLIKIVFLSSTPYFGEQGNWNGISNVQQRNFISELEQNTKRWQQSFLRLVGYPDIKNRALYQTLQLHFDKENLQDWAKQLPVLFGLDLRQLYTSLKTPAIHISGDQDAVCLAKAEQLTELNPSIKNFQIPDCGHAPFITHKSEFLSLLRKEHAL